MEWNQKSGMECESGMESEGSTVRDEQYKH